MREKRCPETAALVAARYGGRTIVVSGLAVLVGFAGLTIVPLGELQSVGFGGLVVVAFAVAISVTLLPGLLAFMGTKIDSFRIVRLGLSRPGGWRRWGFWVCHHPIRVLCVAGSPLLWLAWQGTQTRVGTPREDWLPPAMESARGLQDMIDMERGALLQRTRVLVRLPKGEDALSPKGWQVLRDVRGRLLDDDRIAAVLSFTSFDADRPLSRLRFLGTPRAVRNAYVSEDRRTVLLDVIPGEEVEPQDMVEFVNVWRSRLRSELGSDTEILIGGLPGFRADYQNAVSGWFPVVVLLVVSGTFLALALSFRSLLIPLKALVLNLSSVAAGFGIVKLVFQDGLALSALGLSTPVSSVFPVIPTLVFCTVFGLSMDYEVFLVARVAEFKRAGFEEHDAIARGLAHSAPLITSAAAIMVVVFGAFALGQFLVIKMLGLALAASVFIDATLVRVAVGPALLTLAGRWNWWPGNRVVHHA
jgi:RND superfamily putative drug exporter